VAREYRVRACRIGDATVLVALPEGAGDDSPGISLGGAEAARVFMARAGKLRLAIASFPSLTTKDEAVTVTVQSGSVDVAIDETLATFIGKLGLGAEPMARLLFLLAGTVTTLFRLQQDQVTASGLLEACRRLPMAHANVQLLAIDGYPDAVICHSPDAKLSGDTILVAFDTATDTARRHDLNVKANALVSPFRLSHVVLPCVARQVSGILAVNGDEAIWLDAVAEVSPSAAQFHSKHIDTAPEAVALLLRHGQRDLIRDLLAAEGLANSARKTVELPNRSFVFSAEVLQAFDEGLFLSGWMLDPQGHFRTAHVADYSLRKSAIESRWQTYDGLAEVDGKVTPVRGFCVWLERKLKRAAAMAPAIRVALRDGSSFVCRAHSMPGDARGQRDAILSAVHLNALEAGALSAAYRPALSAVAKQLLPQQTVRKVEAYGNPSQRQASVIVPLYGDLRFLRSQIFGFAATPGLRQTSEIIYVLDDPRLTSEAEQRLGSLAKVTGLDLRLVLLSDNCGYATATNAGAQAAEGETLILMNSDVVPAGGGWLQILTDSLRGLASHSVVGPKLLYADDSLQHAGMYFYRLRGGAFQNMHYFKGYGRNFGPANAAREVPAVTGAVMALSAEAFKDVGGFTTDYVIGDYEDSDLCLKLRRRGGTCFYQPAAELYHFERQSIATHPTAKDNGSSAYNRQLHHSLWAGDIASLMENGDFKHDANTY